MRSLPWSISSYVRLEPTDLDPTPAPTPEQRIRVAAALATLMRDRSMRGAEPTANAETIRGVLVMDAEAWARDIGDIRPHLQDYDPVDPKVRFHQAVGREGN